MASGVSEKRSPKQYSEVWSLLLMCTRDSSPPLGRLLEGIVTVKFGLELNWFHPKCWRGLHSMSLECSLKMHNCKINANHCVPNALESRWNGGLADGKSMRTKWLNQLLPPAPSPSSSMPKLLRCYKHITHILTYLQTATRFTLHDRIVVVIAYIHNFFIT